MRRELTAATPRILEIALAADTHHHPVFATIETRVGSVERMAMSAVRLESIARRQAVAAQAVGRMGHGLEMRGIAAAAISAKVVEFEATANSPLQALKDHAMGPSLFAQRVYDAIAVRADKPWPFPTRVHLLVLEETERAVYAHPHLGIATSVHTSNL